MNTKRPPAVTIAAALLAALSALSLMFPLLTTEGIPAFAIYSDVVLGVVGLVNAYGLWMLKRWSVALTTLVSALNILLAAPGMFFAPHGHTPDLEHRGCHWFRLDRLVGGVADLTASLRLKRNERAVYGK